ncbi:MAG: hypothetical protein KAT48_14150 [Bacteroidales bacterium]|nr:hypothetical protein [Bacteroidales bacterium]
MNYRGKTKKFVFTGFEILEDIPDKPAFFINIKKEAGRMIVYILHIISPLFKTEFFNGFFVNFNFITIDTFNDTRM